MLRIRAGYKLKLPVQKSRALEIFKRYRLCELGKSVLDYGSGDNSARPMFDSLGLRYFGWDIGLNVSPPRTADVVNLCYVLNVIREQNARRMVARRAWNLAAAAMLVTIPPRFCLWREDEAQRYQIGFANRADIRSTAYRNELWLRDAIGSGVLLLVPDVFLCSRKQVVDAAFASSAGRQNGRSAGWGEPQLLGRRRLLRWLGVVAGGTVVPALGVASEDEIFRRAQVIVVEFLGVEVSQATRDADLIKDLGGDSLDLVELIMAFEEEFDIEIPDEVAEKIHTLADFVHQYAILSQVDSQ